MAIKFKLLRYFSIASLISIALAAAALVAFYRHTAMQGMVQEKQEQNVAMLRMFTESIWPSHSKFFLSVSTAEPESIRRNAHTPQMIDAIRNTMAGLGVVKIKIYEPGGHTVFSTEPAQIGENRSANAGLNAAQQGSVNSELVHKDKFSAFEQTIADRDLLSTYLPIHNLDDNKIVGIFELYSDVTELSKQIAAIQNKLMLGVLTVLGALYGVLFFIVKRGNDIIRKHEVEGSRAQRELQLARDSLEQRVQKRTEALKKVNADLKSEIGERKRNEARIREMAYYDHLTKLPNRAYFKSQLEASIAYAKRKNQMLAVMFMDLDHFKRINDTLGHTMGDELLQQVSRRLTQCLRGEDMLASASQVPDEAKSNSVARLGGDEFTMLLTDVVSPYNAGKVARRVIESFSEPFRLGIHQVQVSPSLGISFYPFDGQDVDTLLMTADTAMYHAKEQGRNNYQFYSKTMNAAAFEKLSLESSLRKALERNEFILHYQPQVDAKTRKIVGMEALIRWQHPEMGLVSPANFIPLAEETGLIVPIGEWVLNTACRQNKQWQNMGLPPVRIAVNISSPHFRQDRLLEAVTLSLNETQLDASHLELEVTESLLMQNVESTIALLEKLKNMGVKLSIDDFGTGYSSLNYLQRFPIDSLKIDRSFVKDLAENPDDAAITRAIIAMAQSLGLNVVAEGVETEKQMEMLQSQGCHEMQGFLFSQPVSEKIAQQLLRAGSILPKPKTEEIADASGNLLRLVK
jgi:diguanylate cyclase (GGDEF)-like protein